MNKVDGKQTLWANVSALMRLRYGKENMSKLAAESGVGAATMTRIKVQKTSIGTEKLDQLAAALKVEVWQLLCPGFDFVKSALPAESKGTQPDVTLEQVFAILANHLSQMPEHVRKRAGRILFDLADEPANLDPLLMMMATAIRSGQAEDVAKPPAEEMTPSLYPRNLPNQERSEIDRRAQKRK